MEKNPNSQPSSEGEERLIIEHVEEPDEDIGIYLKEGEFNVEKIIDMRIKNGRKQFFVKWEGYPSSQNTWEPAEHLSNIPSMIAQFEADYARKNQKPKPQPKKPDQVTLKPKENMPKKHKASSPLQEETIVKKTKLNPKGEEEKEDGAKDAGNSPVSGGASNFEFDFSDDEKSKPEEAKPSSSASKKEVQNKPTKPNVKPSKAARIMPKDVQQRKLQAMRRKDKIGSFKDKDKPKEILGIKPGKNNEFYFLVEWHKRSDGTKPENSHVSNEEFRTYDTNFLLDFYESKIVIFARKQGKRHRITDKEKSLQEAAPTLSLSANKETNGHHENHKNHPADNRMVVEEKEMRNHVTSNAPVNGDKTLEDIARELDFQTLEEAANTNFMGLGGEEEF